MTLKWLAPAFGVPVFAALVVTFVVPVVQGEEAIIDGLPFLLLLAATLVVGSVLSWKLPANPIGWLFIVFAGIFAIQVPAVLVADSLIDTAPAASAWLYWFGSDREDTWAWIPSIGILLTQIPLHFPDGKLPSPRWRWFRWYTICALIVASAAISTSPAEVNPGVPNPTHIAGLTENPVVTLLVFVGLLAVSFVGGIASLFVRYRGADAVQRTQLRWVLWAVILAVGALILSWLIGIVLNLNVGFLQALVLTGYSLIPISIAFAVLRYRLYDIDRLISRTASYALVSLIVVGAYLIVVASVSLLLPGLPELGVALATLAAAALFLPILHGVRRVVDRRFDRASYNAEKVVEQFGDRLRTGADPHTAPADFLLAVERTLQPSSIGLWTPTDRA